jgi:hypothetical protein
MNCHRPARRLGAATLLVLLFILAPLATAEERGALAGLDILLVSPDAADGAWIAKVLTTHGAKVTTAPWEGAGIERAGESDLVVVAGKARGSGGRVVKGYTVPVLGVGSAGYAYFGSMRLKHGAPFS